MEIKPIIAQPRDLNPQGSEEVKPKAPVVELEAKKVEKEAKTDTVTISPEALKMVAANIEFVRVPPWTPQTIDPTK
jgi:hypothetical protein